MPANPAVATGVYVPPFAPVTSTATTSAARATATATGTTSISFAQIASSSGTGAGGTGTATTTALIVDSTGGVDSSSLLEYFTKPYIDAHTLSRPSWRYAYILWMVIAFILLVWSLAYQLSGPGSGALGTWFRKWSIRRVVLGRGRSKHGERKGKKRRAWTSPTIAQMLAVVGLVGLCVCLSVAGNDYINPTTCTFGGTCPYNLGAGSGPPKSTYHVKRALPKRWNVPSSDEPASPMPAAMFFHHKQTKRGVNNPNGWAPYNDPLLAAPNHDVAASWWSAADRLGLISYAMFPLTVSLAVKQWPFNLWASPFLTNYHFDKTAILHRWSGRVIWLFSSAHTAAWLYELITDKDPFGRAVLVDVFQYFRFVAGVVAYGVLTLMMILSFSPIRNKYYEVFYWSHVVMVVLFLVGCLIHTKPLMGWPISALGLWGAERLARIVILFYVNRYGWNVGVALGKRHSGQSFSVLASEKTDGGEASSYAVTPFTQNSNSFDYSSPYSPTHEKRPSYYDFGPGQDTTYLDQHQYPHPLPNEPSPTRHPLPLGAAPPRPESLYRQVDYPPPQLLSTLPNSTSKPKPGYASAQLLPGRMIRLTLNVPCTVRWRPGQHVFLTLPGVRFLQGHPYTITNVDERAKGIVPPGGRGLLKADGTEMVFLIRAQKGFSKALWDHVVAKRQAKEAAGQATAEIAKGVNLRSLISWPLGSAGRVTWDDYDSILVICGGTGITFGVAVLEYTCRRMARMASAARTKADAKFKTQRVRFVWILREYAHLSWVAPALRRCLELLSNTSQLQVDLFVSRHEPIRGPKLPSKTTPGGLYSYDSDPLAPPVRPFAPRSSTGRDSVDSDWSDSDTELVPPSRAFSDVDTHVSSVTEMILFDGEDDAISPAETAISSQVRRQGKLRRARSRREQGHRHKPSQPSRASSSHDLDRPEIDLGLADGRPHFPSADFPTRSRASPSLYSPHSFVETGSFAELGLTNDDQSERYSFGGGGSSIRQLMKGSESRLNVGSGGVDETGEVAVDLSAQDQEDLDIVAELARPGHPKLDAIMDAEIARSAGKTMVACCGPTELNTLVRHLVSDRIDLRKVWRGDPRGQVSLVCEDFSF